jgi:hypothetical protein
MCLKLSWAAAGTLVCVLVHVCVCECFPVLLKWGKIWDLISFHLLLLLKMYGLVIFVTTVSWHMLLAC